MSKKLFLGIVMVFVLGIAFFLFNHSSSLSYKEFINEFLSEDENVIEITVETRSSIQNKEFIATVEDTKIIDRIMNEPGMKLKKTRNPDNLDFSIYVNTLSIKTDKGLYYFYFDETNLYIEQSEYTSNYHTNTGLTLFNVIQSEDLDWVEID